MFTIGQQFATLDHAFAQTEYSNNIDFKMLINKCNYKDNSNKYLDDHSIYTSKELNIIRTILEDNYKLLYNQQGDILETIKNEMSALTLEDKQKYLSEFSKDFEFNTDAYIRMTKSAVAKLKEIRSCQANCEFKIIKQNKKLDTLKELFDKLTNVSNHIDITSSLDSFRKSLDEIFASIKAEKNNINKELLQTLLYTEFVTQQISDPFIKTITIYACPICLENQVDAFIPECGHTGCSDCLTKNNTCAICRCTKSELKKLYFNGSILAKRDIKHIGVIPNQVNIYNNFTELD